MNLQIPDCLNIEQRLLTVNSGGNKIKVKNFESIARKRGGVTEFITKCVLCMREDLELNINLQFLEFSFVLDNKIPKIVFKGTLKNSDSESKQVYFARQYLLIKMAIITLGEYYKKFLNTPDALDVTYDQTITPTESAMVIREGEQNLIIEPEGDCTITFPEKDLVAIIINCLTALSYSLIDRASGQSEA